MLHGWLGQGVNKSLGDQDSAEGCVLDRASTGMGGQSCGDGHRPTSRL